MILERVRGKIRQEVAEEQYGFVEGKGTRNAIFIVRMLSEKAIEMQKDLYLCFIDYEKAFDRVGHKDIVDMLMKIGIDGKDLRVITNLYWNQKAAVRVAGGISEWIEIKRGVRQGCGMSPDLFSLYGEMIMREIEGMEGFSVGGRNVNNIRYADDTVLIADSKEKLQKLLDTVKTKSEVHGLKINASKTEILVVSKKEANPQCVIAVDGKEIKQVQQFSYLGSNIKSDGRCDAEIVRRIAIAKGAFNNMKHLLVNRNISLTTRTRAVKTFAWSVLLYGSETWTISKVMENRLEAFEMWCWRRVLKISWTERKTNQEVLNRIGAKRELIKHIRTKQLSFLGHVMRRGQLENLSLTGRVPGNRARGRQRDTYMKGLVKTLGGRWTAGGLLQMTSDRKKWRTMVANVRMDTALR